MDLLILPPKFQALDSNGDPLTGGKLHTYAAGTSNEETTYSDYALATANANPVVLDSRGEAVVHCANALKLVLKDSSDNTIWTVDNVTPIQLSVFAAVNTSLPGALVRAKFEHVDDDTIYIHPGVYHHQGTTEQIVYWDSKLTLDMAGLGNSEWRYIYIDDSAIVTAATNLLTASEFTHNTTAPTWSDAKHGWYSGSDRCIFAVLTDGTADIIDFIHDGGDFVLYDEYITERSGADLEDSFVDVDMATSVPGFSTKAAIAATLEVKTTDGTIVMWARPNGSAAANGRLLVSLERIGTDQDIRVGGLTVFLDSSQIFEIRLSRSGDDTAGILCEGWYFPIGM